MNIKEIMLRNENNLNENACRDKDAIRIFDLEERFENEWLNNLGDDYCEK